MHQMKTLPTKQTKRNVSKIRRNISITPNISKQAEKVAAKSGLSFSSWNEQLIRAELRSHGAWVNL
jgi:hypothetical protein